MLGFFLLNTEIYICLQILYILIIGTILNEKILNLKFKFNVLKWTCLFSSLTLFYSFFILWNNVYYEAILLNYQLICDNIAFFFKFFILFLSFFCIIISCDYCYYENIKTFEYSILLLLSLIGILTIISSYDLMTMYLSIELQSLCFYIVTNLKFYSNFSVEASLKYFILGALSSGILLFGISLLYGFTGLTNFQDLLILFYYLNWDLNNFYFYEISLLSIIFIYSGILFKIGVVPFHLWISDIYEGAPTNITLFFAVIPQISIFVLLIRFNFIFMYAYLKELHLLFLILSICSIIVGTLGAIYQTKLKRLIAYSSISNMGYILSMLSLFNIENLYSVIFYIINYNIIVLGLWLLILIFRNKSNYLKFKDIGELFLLYNSNKYLAFIFFIFLFSAMGIPPMLGFFSKLYLYLNIIQLKMYLFSIFLIILGCIGIIYYLRLIKIMFSYINDKFLFLCDFGEIKACILIILVFLNIFFFLYPSHLILLIHNLILFIL